MNRNWFKGLCVLLLALPGGETDARPLPSTSVSVRETLAEGAVRFPTASGVEIKGRSEGGMPVHVRVTTSGGVTHHSRPQVQGGAFSCRYPADFEGAPPISAGLLYVDVTDAEWDGSAAREHQAEILLVVRGTGESVPDLPLGFLEDFVDAAGNKDSRSRQWNRHRALINQFMKGRAAGLMGIQKPVFDLAQEADFQWFKQNAALYDFEHRDRDWSLPLGNRVHRGFWQAMWNGWFNSSNDHPWDGDPANRAPSNYRPYTFANDLADLLILLQMVRAEVPEQREEKRGLAGEVLENLLALQHRSPENFALKEPGGQQEFYTAGAFRYGLFETGEWLVEGRGWFANPGFRDFARGGVFNGRCLWALGECLLREPEGPRRAAIREALALGLRFCLKDARKYLKETPGGRVLWNPTTPGEHAYLLLGTLAAYRAQPDLEFDLGSGVVSLRRIALDGVEALAESIGSGNGRTRYSNATAMNLAALAEGLLVFPQAPEASRWREVAVREADYWVGLKALDASWPTPMFGHMTAGDGMTFVLGKGERPHVSLYVGGHWLHALSSLYAATGEVRYKERADQVLGYYCGANPLSVRLINEIGAVYNRVSDEDGDGCEDAIHWNAYPESTAFVQIGLLHFLEALRGKRVQ
jgi:hypothetical protein